MDLDKILDEYDDRKKHESEAARVEAEKQENCERLHSRL